MERRRYNGRAMPYRSHLWTFVVLVLAGSARAESVAWKECLKQPAAWYSGSEARRIADNVLCYQLDCGGWPKNVDMAGPLDEPAKAKLLEQRGKRVEATIDNGATRTQMAFLARVYRATGDERYAKAFLAGVDFLLASQYENGGWPQFPHRPGYYQRITFNDDAMIGVMTLLREIGRGAKEYDFVDSARRSRAARAVDRGVACILKCQVMVDGKRTAWCAQHDEKTLRPAPARSYEKISLSGSESVGIVRFLMAIERPEPEVAEAVRSAVRWFESAKLVGIRQADKPDPALPRGRDKVIVWDESAGPLWARFYEIGTNRPIFCGRDGVVKYSLAEIEHERRVGYAWYVTEPAALLSKDYPAWETRLRLAGQK